MDPQEPSLANFSKLLSPSFIFRRLWLTWSNQAFTEPFREVLVTGFAARDADNRVRNCVIVFDKLVSAPLDQQFDQIERCPLVAVCKPMVADNAVDQCRRLLMNASVVSVVRVRNRRFDRVLIDDPNGSAMLERFRVPADRICPSDAVVSPTD